MTIRFQCAACQQPLEIDDQWALKPVACPYCRKTVTAPAESTLGTPAQVPTAHRMTETGVAGGLAAVDPIQGFPTSRPAATSSNVVAIVALALSCAALLAFFGSMIVTASHAHELQELAERVEEVGQFKAASEFAEQYDGGFPGWMIAYSMLALVGFVLWLAATVCGLIGLRLMYRRRLAIAALVLNVIPLLMLCSGVALGFVLLVLCYPIVG